MEILAPSFFLIGCAMLVTPNQDLGIEEFLSWVLQSHRMPVSRHWNLGGVAPSESEWLKFLEIALQN
ncbi:unnamed protein product [Haemonchus placei]|uniref:Secreted protein n=1 Tax=Haemonchus placei TaxID=6290 RepID=A0A0N4WL44_HAEPC|nr:unnamed protein product [Haemonchus placei]